MKSFIILFWFAVIAGQLNTASPPIMTNPLRNTEHPFRKWKSTERKRLMSEYPGLSYFVIRNSKTCRYWIFLTKRNNRR